MATREIKGIKVGSAVRITGSGTPISKTWFGMDSPFSQILATYPRKGKFTLYYPASTEGAGKYMAVFRGEDEFFWTVRSRTAEGAMAGAMKELLRRA